VAVCIVRLSVCHTQISPKLSEIDVSLLGNLNRNPGFPIRICHQIHDRKYSFPILGVSGLVLFPFRQKWAVGLVNRSVGTVTSLDTRIALPFSSCTLCASLYAQLQCKKRRTQEQVRHRPESSWASSSYHLIWDDTLLLLSLICICTHVVDKIARYELQHYKNRLDSISCSYVVRGH